MRLKCSHGIFLDAIPLIGDMSLNLSWNISKKTYDSKLDIYNRITVCQLPLYDTSELRNVVTANLTLSPFSTQFRSGLVINKL